MRGGTWILACAWVLFGPIGSGDGFVSPIGKYNLSGNFTYKYAGQVIQGTHKGWMTLNNRKFYGVTTANVGAKATSRFTLSRRPSARSNSVCNITGTITVVDDAGPLTYNVFNGMIYFKITSTNRISYSGVVKARITSGEDAGALLALSYRGIK